MSPEQNKRIAYDLAVEYMRQRKLLSDVDENIPKMVERFGNVCELFSESIRKDQKLNNLF